MLLQDLVVDQEYSNYSPKVHIASFAAREGCGRRLDNLCVCVCVVKKEKFKVNRDFCLGMQIILLIPFIIRMHYDSWCVKLHTPATTITYASRSANLRRKQVS